ncbi:HTH-type transcriptional regulator gltC [Delftia tsuruhatensis]|uniref:LysR family transcriptional regulator n=1 Tax=Delftia tsuruhatensis TaxID=180282 RepID=UPI001E800B09|nr:LysR family transcriptional regulator [Delftia tsuruhatensis]CAB5706569.1 HTH-type transcriptional regulator gltC [Delftia tsuruhatensis]CAC9675446.1 HTH-type transcriptional regulator gltC [Delftia tsuruhatensis]
MSLTLRQLKYFTAVAEVGRISHAALQLNISQSAVTTAVRELEEMLGQQLFERQPHGVELTRAGRRFLSHAYAVLSAADEAIRMPHEGVNVEGTLTVAATYTVLGYFLPHHLQRFEQLHPQIKVKVHEVVREAIEEGLITQQYDMGVLLTSNVVLRELSLETFFGSQRRLWVPAKHALLEKAEVTLADVAAEPYILLTVDEAAGTAMKYWSKTPYQPQIRLRTSSVEAVRSTVANGLGVTVLSDMVYRPWSLEGKRIETISLRDAVPTMNIGLGWKQGIEFSPAMTAFRDYFRQLFLEPVLHQGRRRPGG